MAVSPATLRHHGDARLFTWAPVAAAVVVLAGFARTYYVKSAFDGPPLSLLQHVHGAVMTGWFALFIVQAQLIASRRLSLHRTLGLLGAGWAGLVLVVGTITAISGAARGASPGPPPLVFLAVPLGDMAVFGILVGGGLVLRHRRDIHERLMLLGSLSILAAAFARIPVDVIAQGGPLAYFGLTDLCILACVAWDTVSNGRLHPAFGWGALLVVASHPLRLLVAGTAAWLRFAESIVP
jgi:hypothetical protein